MGLTMVEKILAKKSGNDIVVPGELVDVCPDIVMSQAMTPGAIRVIRELGVSNLYDTSRIVIIIDHQVPPTTAVRANRDKLIRDFVNEFNIENFYDGHKGIAHLVMIENGHVLPGSLVIGTDSHSTIYGSLGALGTGIGFTECASVWVTGKLWMKVPESVKINLCGSFPKGVYAKDLILSYIGEVTADGCTYKSVEFQGDMVPKLTMSQRMTLACLSMEMGVKCAFIPPDEVTLDYLKERTKKDFEPIWPDKDARYVKEYVVEADRLVPVVALPHCVDNVRPISEVIGLSIHQAFVGTCSNGNFEDLEVVSGILKGEKVHAGVRFIIAPASQEVALKAAKAGIIQTLIEAGALVMNPGCSACNTVGGALADGEVCISSATRNFLGRLGNPKSDIYLGSPATVAASSIRGVITDPREFIN